MKNIIYKPSALISIQADLPLIARQLWNILFIKAYEQLKTEEFHEITEQDILAYFPYETRNTEHLKEMLRRLITTLVECNIIGKDSTGWEAFTLLANAELKDGICEFSFSPKLRKKLQNPVMYAKISLLISMRFTSRYALILYELACDFQNTGQTKWITIANFNKIMGVNYTSFKHLNQDVIKPAIKQVNQSNLFVKLEKKKTGRSISHIKFHISKNTEMQGELPLWEPTKKQQASAIKNMLQS